jgi:PAS domain S-box-containing protein
MTQKYPARIADAAAGSAPLAPPAEAEQGAASHRWVPVVLPPLVGLLTLGLTFLYWQSEEKSSRAKQEQNFQAAADQIAYNLKDRMATYEVVLRGVKGYFEGSERIDRAEFQAYVGALQLRETRPGLQGVSLIMQLPGSALAAHLDDMRQRGFSQYAVRPEGAREVLAPITHIEPLEGNNLKALGFDVLTLPAAKEALDRARDTGELALSGQLTLRQTGNSGLVMYMPLYGARMETRTVQGRRSGLAGWVSAPFRLEDVIRGMSREFDADIGLQISDVTQAGAAETLLFSNVVLQAADRGTRPSGQQVQRVLELGGRRWVLQMSPLPAFAARFQDEGHHPVALMGTVLSLLLAWFTWLLATGRERAVALARDMTAELRATRDDLESTLNAIPDLLFDVGLDGCIHHYRSARSEQLAVPPEMFLGRLLRDVVPPEAAAGCQAALEAAHRTGYSAGHQYRLELQGITHWFELSIARKESAAPGDEPRFIALSRDITERKQAEARTHQLAYFDALTGLPNRRMLLDRMEHALRSAQQTAQVGAVLYIDLDNFKQINDARGHTLGDTLLMQVAQRLTQ